MVINHQILEKLIDQAKASPRLRMILDLRNSAEDGSQRMLNALEPGTVMPIHRHHASSETVVILRGRIRWIFYDDNGQETERVVLDANGEPRMLNVEKDRWHSLECLESGSVLYESKDGPYHPLEEDEIMVKQKMGSMKSKKIIALAKGVWAFCSYLFIPQRRPKDYYNL